MAAAIEHHASDESLTVRFEPAKYRDRYRENLQALIDAKMLKEAMKPEVARRVPTAALDILEMLKASMQRVKKPVAVVEPAPQAVPTPKRSRKALPS